MSGVLESGGSVWRLERRGPIAVATFHCPPRNFMTFVGMEELEAIVEEVAADDSLTVLLIASSLPGYFIAHADLEDLVHWGRGEPYAGDPESWARVLPRLGTIPQVTIAAIDGQAWGGGCELSLACTLRIAGPDAHFCLVEVALGLIPGGGGTQRLPRLIGPGRAAEIILSGRQVFPDEALRIGLVQAVIDEQPFLEAAVAWAGRIASRPPTALRAAKRALHGGASLPLTEALAFETSCVVDLLFDPLTLAIEEAAIVRYRNTPPEETVTF